MKKKQPKVYFLTQVKNIQLYHQGSLVDWMDLRIEYENHDNQVSYEIE